MHIKFDMSDLMRGDMRAQAEYYREMIQNGIMTPNEVRKSLKLNTLEGLDVPFNLNAQPAVMPQQKTTGDEN
jgi:phage portal protein BeeE